MANSFPRSLDVVINISRPQTEIATDMTLMACCYVGADTTVPAGNLFRIYSSLDAVAGDFQTSDAGYKMAQAFFSMSIHPEKLAICELPSAVDADTVEAALTAIADAAKAAGTPIYGWAFDASLRDGAVQPVIASWMEAQDMAFCILCSNSINAYDSANSTDIGSVCKAAGYKRTGCFWHNDASFYPDVAYIAYALTVDYSEADSAITMKFKVLDGIEPATLTQTQLQVLENKRYNTYILIGNNSRTVREGVQSNPTWYTDTLINLDNFKEELQVEVFNVFLRNKKIPYNTAGQNLLISAAAKICRQYTDNGVFAARTVEDDTQENGVTTLPATNIVPSPIAGATTSDRAARIAPPIQIVAYEAGAMHSLTINVDVYE
jgi:hypothetical protein